MTDLIMNKSIHPEASLRDEQVAIAEAVLEMEAVYISKRVKF